MQLEYQKELYALEFKYAKLYTPLYQEVSNTLSQYSGYFNHGVLVIEEAIVYV